MTAAHEFLRAGTRHHHLQVDDAFGHFDLASQTSYVEFLLAHARAIVPIEAALANALSALPWRPRSSFLQDDLRVLGCELPSMLALELPADSPHLSGMLYVIEGSRLGGGILASRVGDFLPTLYLSAVHQKGEWRALLAAIDARAAAEPPEWLEAALDGAKLAFAMFSEAARQVPAAS